MEYFNIPKQKPQTVSKEKYTKIEEEFNSFKASVISEIATLKEHQSQQLSAMASCYNQGMPYWPSMQPSMPGIPPSIPGMPQSMPSMPPSMPGMPSTQSHCAQTTSSMGYSHPIGPHYMSGLHMQSSSGSFSPMQSVHSYHKSSQDEHIGENVHPIAIPHESPPLFDESYVVRF